MKKLSVFLVLGLLFLLLTLSCGGGGSSSDGGSTAFSLSGNWSGQFVSTRNANQGGKLTATISQSGTQITGTINITIPNEGVVTGNLSGTVSNSQGPGTISFGSVIGQLGNLTFSGNYTSTQMSGNYNQTAGGNDAGTWTLNK